MSAQCLCLNNKFYLSSRFDHLAAALPPDTLRSFAIEFDCLVTRQFERILGQPEDTLRAVWVPVAAEHAHESEDDDERFDDVHAVRLGLPLSRGAGAGRKTLLAKSPTLFPGAFLRQFMPAAGICAQNKTPDQLIDPFFRSAAGLEPFHHAGTALEHGYCSWVYIIG